MLLDTVYDYSSDSSDKEEEIDREREHLESNILENHEQEKNKNILACISSELEDKYAIAPNIDNYIETLMLSSKMMNTVKNTSRVLNPYFFIDVKPSNLQRNIVSKLIDQYNTKLSAQGMPFKAKSLLYSDLLSPQPLHVTLTANYMHKDSATLNAVRTDLVSECKSFKPFDISLKPDLVVFQNEFSSKYFLALEVEKKCATQSLDPLTKQIKSTLERHISASFNGAYKMTNSFDETGLYIYHISIACIDNEENLNLSKLPQISVDPVDLAQLNFPCTEFKMTKMRSQLSIPLGNPEFKRFKLPIF